MTPWSPAMLSVLLLPAALLSGCHRPDPQKPDGPDLSADSADTADTAGTWIPSGAPFDLPPGITNLIVVHADTLRADRLGLYGHERETTPLLSARGGRVIRGMQAVAPWTLPSSASLLTGLEPHRHGLYLADGPAQTLSAAIPTLLDGFSAAGWRSALVSGNGWVGDQTLLSKDFDDNFILGKTWPKDNLLEQVDQALGWIDRQPAEPFLLMLQPMNTHDPYFSPDSVAGTFIDPEDLPFDPKDDHSGQEQSINAAWLTDPVGTTEAVSAAYDEQILAFDASMDLLMQGLEARGLLESTLIVLTADHGETLGDADLPVFGHGGLLRPEALEIPLVLFHPAIPPAAMDCLSMNIDTLPTLFSAIDLPPISDAIISGIDGRPLEPGCRDSTRSFLHLNGELTVGLRTSEWQIYHPCNSGATVIYNNITDPKGTTPIPNVEIREWPSLREELLDWIAALNTPGANRSCPQLPR